MKPLRILVLMHESLVPPESIEGLTIKQYDEIKTEFDVVQALRKAGHEVRPLGVYDKLADLRTSIGEWKPEIVFNLLEEFQGIAALYRM